MAKYHPPRDFDPSELARQVNIEQSSQTQNEFGETVLSWTTYVADVWASVLFKQSKWVDAQNAHQLSRIQLYEVIIRYIDGITLDMRINYGGRIMTITGIDNDQEMNYRLTIHCAEVLHV